MVFLDRCWDGVKRFCRRTGVRTAEENANATEAMYGVFGTTTVVALDALTFSSSMAALAVYVARSWQLDGSASPGSLQFLLRSVFTLIIASAWMLVLRRWFGYLKWPRWWVIPYVFVILGPWAWFFVHRLGMGGDFVCLFLLQSPVTFAYVWRAHQRAKRPSNRR